MDSLVCEASSAVAGNDGKGVRPHNGKEKDEKPHVLYGFEDPNRNMINNWNFDEPLDDSGWFVDGANGTRVLGGNSGQWCLRVNDRTTKESGPKQRITAIKPETSYYVSCFLKFPNHPEEEMFFKAYFHIFVKYEGIEQPKKMRIGKLNFLRGPLDWQQFGGDFTTDDQVIEWIDLCWMVEPEGVDYYLDTVSMIELPADPDWKAHMSKQIEQIRTSPVKIRVNFPKYSDPKEFTIQIRQKKSEFAFGASIHANVFNANEKYRECFFKHFEWAVFTNDTKWQMIEKNKDDFQLGKVDKVMESLNEKGITTRGHTIHWNRMQSCPDWIHHLESDKLQDELDRRTKYIVEHFKGQFVHWDVINEHLHNRYMDQRTGNHNQLTRAFNLAHEIDPECHLFINDFEVVRNGELTSSQANLARQLQAEGAPIHGIGAQSHLRPIPIPIPVLKKRVEIISAVGLPVMISEFSVHHNDVSIRARGLEESLYVYMSSPQVKGIIAWTFWDQRCCSDDMPLFEGDDLEPNEAGRMLISLIKKWRTEDINLQPEKRRTAKRFRAYHGLYELEVFRKDERVWGQSFKVIPGEFLKLDIDVELQGGLVRTNTPSECQEEVMPEDDKNDDDGNDEDNDNEDESEASDDEWVTEAAI